jgi:hypothetical protein
MPKSVKCDYVSFEVCIVATMKITVVWDVTPRSLVEVYQCFGCKYCLHLQDCKADSTLYYRNNDRTINSTNS